MDMHPLITTASDKTAYPPFSKNELQPINSGSYNQAPHSNTDTEIEYGVHREIAHEAWRESFRREDAYNAGRDPDEPLFTGYDTDLDGSNGWESDRSWHLC